MGGNKGVAIARNVGLDNVKGEYIAFVDADYYVLLNYYEILYNNLKNANENIAINCIPIAMSTDKNYIYPTIVAMTSVMENKEENTHCHFHILHSSDLDHEDKQKILSLQDKYKNCHINLVDISDKFNYIKVNNEIAITSYYRLFLSDILQDVDKIIWLDGDTLTLRDLSGLYSINMNDNYYMGFLNDSPYEIDKIFNIANDHCICAGVMLINLEKIRCDKITKKFHDFIKKNNDKLESHDQTVINTVCNEKIGILPAKYGIFNSMLLVDTRKVKYILDLYRTSSKYTKDEFVTAIKDPYIIHFTVKPWWSYFNRKKIRYVNNNSKYINYKNLLYKNTKKIWIKYAKKTQFWDEIESKYKLNKKRGR